MNWLTNFVRPKLKSLVHTKEVPDNLWTSCPNCEQMLFHRDLELSQNVCKYCQHHMRINAKQRLDYLFDQSNYSTIKSVDTCKDPLKFKDIKKYSDRLKAAQDKSGQKDAVIVAKGTISGMPAVIAAFDFGFMGGSMGAAAGQALIDAAQNALQSKAALLLVPASGGARMQEGILSLMQMARTTMAISKVKEARLPYIVLLTDPTTGGVMASFAMLGDIHVAEPGATLAFTGARVIKETIREELPAGFQKSEYLQAHGMVDLVVERQKLPQELGKILRTLMVPKL